MCIRDRDKAAFDMTPETARKAVDFMFRSPSAALKVEFQGCLLYTSDAADERSSVDLGGRRIIKKKKSKSNRGRTVQQTKYRDDRSDERWYMRIMREKEHRKRR